MKTRFHRNLNATNGNAWSYVDPDTGKARQFATGVAYAVDVKQPSGKKFNECLAGGNRAVFAWFKCGDLRPDVPANVPPAARRVRFNPKRGDRFFHVDGMRVDALDVVYVLADGTCWTI